MDRKKYAFACYPNYGYHNPENVSIAILEADNPDQAKDYLENQIQIRDVEFIGIIPGSIITVPESFKKCK